jgi:LmbE family N-acetylglucosaminyl deacetylase
LTNKYNKTAMVVTAHPDDAEWGCSGSVAKWTREGWDVIYVLCTDGSKGSEDRNISEKKLITIREEEQRKAGEILGLKAVKFLGYPDGYLEPTLDLRKDISREIRKYKPSILITTNPTRDLLGRGYIGHPDHFAAGEATLSAVFPSSRDHLTFPELIKEGYEPHKVKEVWINMFNAGNNDHLFFNPIEKQDLEKAIKALLAHKSQISDSKRAKEFMTSRRKEVGKMCNSKFAETFTKFELN